MTKPVLTIEGLHVRRGGHLLLDRVDWEVIPGENWVLLGPNGSGKTTLLKIICGFMAPTEGVLKLFGKTYGRADWNLVRKRIGMVSSSLGTRVENHETALDLLVSGKYSQINFWGEPSSRDLSRARRMLEEVGCEGRAGQTWETLSQGERQRLLIGRALMAHLKLLILDEPCAGLDPVARESFLAFLGRLLREKKIRNCILVTHHVEEILPQFGNVICLAEGKTVARGKKRDVMTHTVMKRAYGSRVRLENANNRYSMKVYPGKNSAFSK